MTARRDRAVYLMGYHSQTILPGIDVLLGEWGGVESHTELLKGIAPLKASLRRLFPNQEAEEMNESLDNIYDTFKSLRKGDYKDEHEAREKYERIEDSFEEIDAKIKAYSEGKLDGGRFMFYRIGRTIGGWDMDLDIPQLSEDQLSNLTGFMRSVGASKVANRTIEVNEHIGEEPMIASSEIYGLHVRMMNFLDSGIVRQNINNESESTSGLTGLPDLSQFESDAVFLLEDESRPLSISFLDIDNLKRLNSEIGHDAADEVIKELSDLLVSEFSGRDDVYHRSGDEFLATMPNTTLKESELFLDRVIQKVERYEFSTSEGTVNATISAGVSTYPDQAEDLDKLRKLANEAMHNSKDKGKSQVSLA